MTQKTFRVKKFMTNKNSSFKSPNFKDLILKRNNHNCEFFAIKILIHFVRSSYITKRSKTMNSDHLFVTWLAIFFNETL